jgi:3-dehydro-L-gulonate 2-dehydrogenase
VHPDRPLSYPGENSLKTRKDHLANGIIVDELVWAKVQALATPK